MEYDELIDKIKDALKITKLEIYDCKVTEITEYKDKYYERDDFDWLKDIISDEVCDEPEYVNLTDEEFDKAMEEKVEWLGWERVILLKVSV